MFTGDEALQDVDHSIEGSTSLLLWIFFARVEPPYVQEMHRSACAVFG